MSSSSNTIVAHLHSVVEQLTKILNELEQLNDPKCRCTKEEKQGYNNYDKGDGDWRCRLCDGYI